jgi:hypothetical protein
MAKLLLTCCKNVVLVMSQTLIQMQSDVNFSLVISGEEKGPTNNR